MCLYINNNMVIKPNKNGYIIGYKIVNKKTLKSTYGNVPYTKGKVIYGYKTVITKPNCYYRTKVSKKLTDLEINNSTVNYGIHVYLNKNQALFYLLKTNDIIIKVKGHINDLRAVGSNNGSSDGAVFTKVKVL